MMPLRRGLSLPMGNCTVTWAVAPGCSFSHSILLKVKVPSAMTGKAMMAIHNKINVNFFIFLLVRVKAFSFLCGKYRESFSKIKMI